MGVSRDHSDIGELEAGPGDNHSSGTGANPKPRELPDFVEPDTHSSPEGGKYEPFESRLAFILTMFRMSTHIMFTWEQLK
ncbi:hypothetical protein HDU93_000550, partial [Gonapodya sp. JEL0774]